MSNELTFRDIEEVAKKQFSQEDDPIIRVNINGQWVGMALAAGLCLKNENVILLSPVEQKND